MTLTFIDRHNIDFLLNDWLKTNAFVQRPAFSDHSPGTFSAVLDLSEKLSMESFPTHYKKSDQQEPYLEVGRVVLIPEIGAVTIDFG
jgi:butyryl-CoA dehydrogenase